MTTFDYHIEIGFKLSKKFKNEFNYFNDNFCNYKTYGEAAEIITKSPSGLAGYIDFHLHYKASFKTFLQSELPSVDKVEDGIFFFFAYYYRQELQKMYDRIKTEGSSKSITNLDIEILQNIFSVDVEAFEDKSYEDYLHILETILDVTSDISTQDYYLSAEFVSAIQCIEKGLVAVAYICIDQYIENMFQHYFDYKLLITANELEVRKKQASEAGKKGAANRWIPKDKTKEFAIELRNNGSYRNDNHAASKIHMEVIEFGKSHGFYFSNEFQAQKTIYNWLRKSHER